MRRLILSLPLILLTSCIDDVEQMGVSVLNDQPAAVAAPCKSQEKEPPVIELLLTEEGNHPGGGDDRVLWRAVPREPSFGAFVTPIGAAPEGYETTTPLSDELVPSTRYTLYIHSGGVIVFRPQDLESGRIKSETGQRAPEGFLDYAREGCEGGDLVDGTEPVVLQLAD